MAVDFEKIEKIAKEHKVKMDPLSAYYKLEIGNCRVYVARTKKVNRIDLSGFKFTHPAVKVLEDDYRFSHRMGRVAGQIDFSKSENLVLEAFGTALAFMKALAGEEVQLSRKYRDEVKHLQENPEPSRRPRPQPAPQGEAAHQ